MFIHKTKEYQKKINEDDIINVNPNPEELDDHSDASNSDGEDGLGNDVNCENKTPLERYVKITEKQITDKRILIAKLQEKTNDITKRINRVKSDASSGNICHNCHFRLRHTARTCTMSKCTSVFNCGEEKYRIGETNTREIQSQIRKHEMELNKLMTELENKKTAINASKASLSRKIENELFRLKKSDYLINGNKNWSLLRKHVYEVENYCQQNFGGKLPARQNISKILSNAIAANSSSLSYHRSKQSRERKRGNHFKSCLENYGVEFSASDECLSSPPRKLKTVSPILATAPTSKKEEMEQLALVMRESLRNRPQPNRRSVIFELSPSS